MVLLRISGLLSVTVSGACADLVSVTHGTGLPASVRGLCRSG